MSDQRFSQAGSRRSFVGSIASSTPPPLTTPRAPIIPPPAPPRSAAQIQASQANSQKSTGPRTPEGKARSSRNATKHGLFCVDIVIEGESRLDYHRYRHEMIRSLDPSNALQLQYAEQVIHNGWKLKRAESTEQVILAARKNDLQRERPGEKHSPGYVLGDLLWHSQDFARVQMYGQRLLNNMNRATNQLRKLKKDHQNGILSDLAGELVAEERQIIENMENEPTAPSPDTTTEPANTCDNPPSPIRIDSPARTPAPMPPRPITPLKPPDWSPPRR